MRQDAVALADAVRAQRGTEAIHAGIELGEAPALLAPDERDRIGHAARRLGEQTAEIHGGGGTHSAIPPAVGKQESKAGGRHPSYSPQPPSISRGSGQRKPAGLEAVGIGQGPIGREVRVIAAVQQCTGRQPSIQVGEAAHLVRRRPGGGNARAGTRTGGRGRRPRPAPPAPPACCVELPSRARPCPARPARLPARGSCVATPVGQWSVWQVCAWMQPSANMKPRAALHQSAPSAMHARDVEGGDDLAARSRCWMRVAQAERRPACCARAAAPRCSGAPTWSVNSSGAAPVPPSAPSTTMKSGVMPVSSIALAMREPFPGMADAQLEAGRLAAGQLAQPRDEIASSRSASRRRCARPARRSPRPSARRAPRRSRASPWPPAARRRGRAWRPAKLDLDHLHLRVARVGGEALLVERPSALRQPK